MITIKNHWHYVFLEEVIEEVMRQLKWRRFEIDYKEDEEFPGLAMGHFQDNSGLIQSCNVWNKNEVQQIFAETGKKPKTCIVLRGNSPDFERKIITIRKIFKVIKDDCKICNQKEGEKV